MADSGTKDRHRAASFSTDSDPRGAAAVGAEKKLLERGLSRACKIKGILNMPGLYRMQNFHNK